jgi:hypothetical protein
MWHDSSVKLWDGVSQLFTLFGKTRAERFNNLKFYHAKDAGFENTV